MKVRVVCRDGTGMNGDTYVTCSMDGLNIEHIARAVDLPAEHLRMVGAALLSDPGALTPRQLYALDVIKDTLKQGVQTSLASTPSFVLESDGPYVLVVLRIERDRVPPGLAVSEPKAIFQPR